MVTGPGRGRRRRPASPRPREPPVSSTGPRPRRLRGPPPRPAPTPGGGPCLAGRRRPPGAQPPRATGRAPPSAPRPPLLPPPEADWLRLALTRNSETRCPGNPRRACGCQSGGGREGRGQGATRAGSRRRGSRPAFPPDQPRSQRPPREPKIRCPQAWHRASTDPTTDAVYASSHSEPFGVRLCASRAASPRRRNQGPRKRRRATQDSGQVALEEGLRGAVIAGRSCTAACAQSSRWGHFKIVTQTIVPFWAFSDWVTAEDLRGPKLGSAPPPRPVHPQCTAGSWFVHSHPPLLPSPSSYAQVRCVAAVDGGLAHSSAFEHHQ